MQPPIVQHVRLDSIPHLDRLRVLTAHLDTLMWTATLAASAFSAKLGNTRPPPQRAAQIAWLDSTMLTGPSRTVRRQCVRRVPVDSMLLRDLLSA